MNLVEAVVGKMESGSYENGIEITKGSDGFYLDNYFKIEMEPLRYVHQIQNLYFDLTGSELEIINKDNEKENH